MRVGTESILKLIGAMDEEQVVEMEWWEEAEVGETGVRVAFTPSNHWCRRGVFDQERKREWGWKKERSYFNL